MPPRPRSSYPAQAQDRIRHSYAHSRTRVMDPILSLSNASVMDGQAPVYYFTLSKSDQTLPC